jgi:hypothetical protein
MFTQLALVAKLPSLELKTKYKQLWGLLPFKHLGPYSQHFVFYLSYELAK